MTTPPASSAIMRNQSDGDAVVYNYDDELVRDTGNVTLDKTSVAGYGFSQKTEPRDPGAFLRDRDVGDQGRKNQRRY